MIVGKGLLTPELIWEFEAKLSVYRGWAERELWWD